MGLYDNVRMQDSPYLSQYVGSITPDVAKYSDLVQDRYNQAADSDDKLTEALGNLQHLGLAGDTQYANELKDNYYQKLMDRSSRGDYENMGRRTKQDAMAFTQAYQPLIQRQNDFAEIAKRVNYDPNIADPDKKAQILQYIQHLNQTPVDANGQFIRDPTGKVKLGGIQDWTYAKDVDINKKLSDLMAKKEADIKQSKFATVGGFRVSTKEELRTPANMRALAGELMNSDPEIKAMMNRDAILKTYKLSDDQVKQQLDAISTTPDQHLSRKGLDQRSKNIHAAANGMTPDQLKQSPVKNAVQNLINQGSTPEQARRQVLNQLVIHDQQAPYTGAMGDLFSVDKVTREEQVDPYALEDYKQKQKKLDNDGNTQYINLPPASDNPVSSSGADFADNLSKTSKSADAISQNIQASVLAALKKTGLSTGDEKKDTQIAVQYAHDPARLATLINKVGDTNPQLAGQLAQLGSNYKSTIESINRQKATVEGLEQGIDLKGMYAQYKKEYPSTIKDNSSNIIKRSLLGPVLDAGLNILQNPKDDPKKPMSYDEFVNTMRSKDNPDGNIIRRAIFDSHPAMQELYDKYQKGINDNAKTYFTAPNQKNTYTSMIPDKSDSWLGKTTDNLEGALKSNHLRGADINDSEGGSKTLAQILGIKNPDGTDGRKKMAGARMLLSDRLSPNGYPTANVTLEDGTTKTIELHGLNPELSKEIMRHVLKGSLTAEDKGYATIQRQHSFQSLGSMEMYPGVDMELERSNPSSVIRPISNDMGVRVIAGGDGKQYELIHLLNGNPVPTKNRDIYKSLEDLKYNLGILSEKKNEAK